MNLEKNILTNVLLFGADKYEKTANVNILKPTITYLTSTKRFERPLIDQLSYPVLSKDSEKNVIKIYFYYFFLYV